MGSEFSGSIGDKLKGNTPGQCEAQGGGPVGWPFIMALERTEGFL